MSEMIVPSPLIFKKEKILILSTSCGIFLTTLDSGLMNISLPEFSAIFHKTPVEVSWIISIFLLTLCLTILFFGRLSDRYGYTKVYCIGLFLFAISATLCGFNHTFSMLIVMRMFEGMGTAMIQSTAAALITTFVSSERRGAAFGTFSFMIGLGSVVGPSLGGFLLSYSSWSWIFWMQAFLSFLTLFISRRLILEKSNHPESKGNSLLSLVKGTQVLTPLMAVTIFGSVTAVILIVPPFLLEKIYSLDPWEVGLFNLTAPFGILALARISGRSINKWGNVRLMLIGLSFMLAAIVGLIFYNPGWGSIPIAMFLLLYGMGGGIFIPPNLTIIMSSVQMGDQGLIASVQRMLQNVGIVVGTYVSTELIHSQTTNGNLVSGFRMCWAFSCILVLLAIICLIKMVKNPG